MPSLWDCSDCPAVREARCCREVRKGKKNHSSHRQIEMCQEWDHLFQLHVPICKPSREMRLRTGVWYIQSGRGYTQLLHTPVRTSFLPLYPWLGNAPVAATHCRKRGKRESDATWAPALLPWSRKLNCSAFTWKLQSTQHHEKYMNSDWCLIFKLLQQKFQWRLATLCFYSNIPHCIEG